MPDQEMIERVAKAIANTPDNDPAVTKIGWDDCDASMRQDYCKEALNAIKAMREPTNKMIKDGDAVCQDYAEADNVWPAMIDSILND